MAEITNTPIIKSKSGRRHKGQFNCTCNNVTMEVTIWGKDEEELDTKIKNFLAK